MALSFSPTETYTLLTGIFHVSFDLKCCIASFKNCSFFHQSEGPFNPKRVKYPSELIRQNAANNPPKECPAIPLSWFTL